MHSRHIVHLDLKTDNIMLVNPQPNSPIKIIDFGEALMVTPSQKLTKRIGTPEFMAPELVGAAPFESSEVQPYDPFKADIWSVGVVLFCMLFGFVPWIIDEGVDDPEKAIFRLVLKGFDADIKEGWGPFFPKELCAASG